MKLRLARLPRALRVSRSACVASFVAVSATPLSSQHAQAQTWSGTVSGDLSVAGNWSPAGVPNAGHDAMFGSATTTNLTLANASLAVAGLRFSGSAPSYTLTLLSTTANAAALSIGADGIVNSSRAKMRIVAQDANTSIVLSGARLSGLVELDAQAPLATINFTAGSNAGSAVIVNASGGSTQFSNSSAGSASISVGAFSSLAFIGNSTAGDAHIDISANARAVSFNGDAGAGTSQIDNAGTLVFAAAASAQSAHLTNSGTLEFTNASSAGSATIVNQSELQFSGTSSASGARLFNSTGATVDISAMSQALTLGSLSGAGALVLGSTPLSIGALGINDSFDGTITGTAATLTKIGAGVLSLGGVVAPGGTVLVAQGTLALDGAVHAPVSVSPLATLTGTGVVSGDLQMAARSIYACVISASSSAPATNGLTIDGSARVGGATLALNAAGPAAGYRAGEDFVVLSATQGVQGSFADVSDNLTYFDPLVIYRPDAVLVELRQGHLPISPHATPNQQSVGGVVSGIPTLGAPLANLPWNVTAGVLDALSGAQYADLVENDLRGSQEFGQLMQSAAREARSPGPWIAIDGQSSRMDSDGNAGGYGVSTHGVVAGLVIAQAANATLVIGAEATQSVLGFDAASASASTSRWDVGIGGAWQARGFSWLGTLAVGTSHDDLVRSVPFPGDSENHGAGIDDSVLSLSTEVDAPLLSAGSGVSLFAGWQWARAQASNFREIQPGATALQGEFPVADQSSLTFGAHASQLFAGAHGPIALQWSLALERAFGQPVPLAIEAFNIAPGDHFEVAGSRPGRLSAGGTFDASVALSHTLALLGRLAATDSERSRNLQLYIGARWAL